VTSARPTTLPEAWRALDERDEIIAAQGARITQLETLVETLMAKVDVLTR
jgi:hypothetical protein